MEHMNPRPFPLIAALVILATASSAPAHAQGATAEAEQLFRDGKRLMQGGEFAEACDAFETSYRIDPALTTKLNLADCREKNGQLASAWGLFVDAERETRGDTKKSGLNKTASTRATALEARLSYLTISVSDESRIEGLTILRNDAVLDEGLWNRAIPVDGGAVVIAGRAAGHEEWSTTVTIPLEGGKVSVEVPKFKELRSLGKTTDGELSHGVEQQPASTSTPRLTSQRKIALGVAVVGLASLATGGWMAVQAKGYEDDALTLCPDPMTPCADAEQATSLSKRAGSRALFANIGFGIGTAAAIGAAILWFTGGPAENRLRAAITPTVHPGFAGVTFAGSF